ncbi:hypothetical protein I3843_13G130800, partial [Carya illinoinensis]
MENPNGFYYVSAPTSPSRWNLQENMEFYSVPTSPTRGVSSNALFGFETEPPSPRTYEDANSTLDDFEFETSCRFNPKDMIVIRDLEKSMFDRPEQQKQQFKKRGDSFPSANMAFADELFCNGKVLPLTPPLKLPPCLQNGSKSGNYSSTFSSSPSSVLRLPFSPRRMWNDDFDPFTVALDNVREEKRGASRPQIRSSDLAEDLDNQNDNYWDHPIAVDESSPTNGLQVKQVEGSPIKLAEPKGLSFARKVRLVKIGNELPSKTNSATSSGSDSVEAGETAKRLESGVGSSSTRESKRQKIKNFLFRSASMSKASEGKKREQNAAAAFWKLPFLRKLSFKPGGSDQDNAGDKTLAKVPKMALMPYKPKLLMCMGFGA